MGVERNTIAKYRTGDPKELSLYDIHQSKLDVFHDFVLECLYSGKSKSKTVKSVYSKGYNGSKSNAFEYLLKIEQREGKTFEAQPYIRTQTEALKYKMGSKGKKSSYARKPASALQKIWSHYVVAVTSLPSEISAEKVLERYRMRWQIELVFKRFKSIFSGESFAVRKEEAVKAWFYGKLFLTIVCETFVKRGHFSPEQEKDRG